MATIFFAGGEDTSFINSGCSVSVSAALFRGAPYSRCAMVTGGGAASVTVPPPINISTGNAGALTSFWAHAQYSNQSANATTNNTILMCIADSGGVVRLLVEGTGTAGQIKLMTRNAAGTQTVLVTSAAGAVASLGAPTPVDLFVNYAVSGQVKLAVGGVTIADTGPGVNVTTDSATSLAAVLFASMGAGQSAWSEIIVKDTSTLGAALQTIPPVAAGNTQSWTPNTVANVNPVTIADANFVSTATANALSEWTVSTTLPPGSWSIDAVVQNARVLVGATGPQHFEWLVRTVDGTDHVTGSVAPITSFGNFSVIWPTNPHTSAAWQAGELINAGIESLA